MIVNEDGVELLVCVVCEQVVGVINTGALARMLDEGEAYICHTCMTGALLFDDGKGEWTEQHLASQSPDYYARLVRETVERRNEEQHGITQSGR